MGIFNTKWPFYISGTMLAVIILFSMYVLNDVIGMGETMTVVNKFCRRTLNSRPVSGISLDYCTVLGLGIILGAFTASIFSNNFRIQITPDCEGSFFSKQFKAFFGGLTGGFLVMLGIQISGESIYGHLVMAIQLSGSSWLFLLALLFSGVILAVMFDRKTNKDK